MLSHLSKSSVDDKTIFKHLDKLSEGKLSHEEFEIINDVKAMKTHQKTIKQRNNNNKNKKKDTNGNI